MEKEKSVKKITLGGILSWIFGILFILVGMSVIAQGSALIGILIILCSAMIIPYFNRIVAEKFHFEISGGVKFALLIVIFILIGFGMANTLTETKTQGTQTSPNVEKTQITQESSGVVKPLPPQKVFIQKSYDDLWSIFSPESKYTDLQREKIFNEEYKGKYVKWQGRVKDVDASVLDNLRLYIEHRNKDVFDLYGGDVTIYMNKDQYNNLIKLSKGDEVTYSAKFKSFGEFISVNFILENGELTP